MNVLLVEDDERIVEFVRRGLETEGHVIDVARGGLEALRRAQAQSCQLIILDVLLPDLDGREVCRRLRADQIATPILMLTALDTLEDKVRGLRIGADDYLAKQFAFEELLARVHALGRRGAHYQEAPSELRAHDLVLNLDTRQVWRGTRPVQLTPKEFALLECLMRTPGKVVSRPQILEKVWGCSRHPLTNVVGLYLTLAAQGGPGCTGSPDRDRARLRLQDPRPRKAASSFRRPERFDSLKVPLARFL